MNLFNNLQINNKINMYKKYNKEILSENITHKICTKRSLRIQRCRSAGYNGQKKFKCTDLWTENVVICRGRFRHKKRLCVDCTYGKQIVLCCNHNLVVYRTSRHSEPKT